MEPFVIDNSIVMCWCFGDQADDFTWSVLERVRESSAVAPAIFPLELGNALVVAERRKKLTQGDAQQFLQLVQALPLRVEQELPQRQWGEILALARQYQLSTYDASYLDLAMRAGLALATSDAPLRAAAKSARVRLIGR